MSEKRDDKKELNLGLTALLSRSAESGHSAEAEPASSKPETEILTVDDDLEALKPEWSSLAASGQWGMLVSVAEGAISTEADIEARLWWIRGHLGAFTLPVSLLAAPFETVCRQLVGDSRVDTYAGLVREIGEIALARLRDVGDHRQEHSLRLALHRLGVLESAVVDSGDRYRSGEPSRAPGRAIGKVSKNRQPFELGTQEALQRSSGAVASAKPNSMRGLRWGGLALFLALAVFGGLVLWRGYFVRPEMLTAQEDLIGPESSVGMVPPFLVARPVSSSLGALFYSMERDVSGAANSLAQPSAPQPAVRQPVAAPAQGAVIPPSALDKKEPSKIDPDTVRTDGPIEGPDFTKGVERNRIPQPKLPDLMPEIEAQPERQLGYPDGSLNIGGEIKSAVVRTEVFDSPSYQARVIARLVPGDKISVEGRVGEWYRIRSRRGRAGFVPSQDIGELEDFKR